ncbi:MAG: ParB/RepB/Spo0J family partition protein [Clostridia bacterium]|nr:ParB/RepB/Spo0J family partition protein [Clostridia bacterium]
MQVLSLPMHKIRPNPNQPRKYFDTVSLEELAQSIEEYGVIQPITVRKVFDGYEIVAGERRFRASENVGLDTIPAIVINADEEKSALIALLENLQRDDLCFFEIAEGYRKLIQERGMTQEELAHKIGKSQSTVANKLRLLKLPPRVKRMVREYTLTERHARALLHLSDEESQIKAAKEICRKHLSITQTEDLVKSMLRAEREHKGNIKYAARTDLRMFTNTVKRALDLIREAGAPADMEKKEYDWGVEYKITVKTSDRA